MTTSDWRSAHGNAAKNGTALVVLESGRDRALRPASPAEPAARDREPNGHFAKGNGIGRTAKARAARDGKLAKVDADADPNARASQQWARRGARRRKVELERMHGGAITDEVSALVDDSWELRGDARYWAAQARAKNDPALARLAETLLTSARQAMRDAWELASREAAARPRANQTASWLQPAPTKNPKETP